MAEKCTSSPALRRFAPQVVETSRRSRRQSSDNKQPRDKSRSRSGRSLAAKAPDSGLASSSEEEDNTFDERSAAKSIKSKARRHSFRVPDLPSIRSSSGSDNGTDRSGPSALWTRCAQDSHRDYERTAISDRRRADSRQAVSSKTRAVAPVEKHLRDQAMAAYPNETVHEPVNHYAIDRDSDEDLAPSPRQSRRKPSQENWELLEIRLHQESLKEQRQDRKAESIRPENGRDTTDLSRNWQQPVALTSDAFPGPTCEDIEIVPQRKAASPPMAGGDLRFPKCLSPQATRLDVHQYPGQSKSSNEDGKRHTGLWTPGGGSSPKINQTGLWMGVNAASAQVPIPRAMQTGLMTPAFERLDPLADPSRHLSPLDDEHPKKRPTLSPRNAMDAVSELSPSPQISSSQCAGASGRLPRQAFVEEDLGTHFPDSFVTQLYNYLSLGYPTMARPYDSELSRITRVPIEKLRANDYSSPSTVTSGTSTGLPSASNQQCERWQALKAYIWEWGRQNSVDNETVSEQITSSDIDDPQRPHSSHASEPPDPGPGSDPASLAVGLSSKDAGIYGWQSGINGRKGSWAC